MSIFIERLTFAECTPTALGSIENLELRRQLEWAVEIAKSTALVAPPGQACCRTVSTRWGEEKPCPHHARWIVGGRSVCGRHASGQYGATFLEKRPRKGGRYSRSWNRVVDAAAKPAKHED